MKKLHSWKLSISEACALQKNLIEKLILSGNPNPRLVAGIDCSSQKNVPGIWAGVVVYDVKKQLVVETVHAYKKTAFPYVSGFLAFREGPVILEAFSKLRSKPDVLIFDGQGVAHPRGLGVASHLGLWLNLPSIGCAKSKLFGDADEPGMEKGEFSPLLNGDKQIGVVLRTRKGVKPLYISPGNLICIKASMEIVLLTCSKFRLPDPIRQAHQAVNLFRRSWANLGNSRGEP